MRNENDGLHDNVALFRARVVMDDPAQNSTGVFSIISPRIEEEKVQGVRFGLTNESAKLNLAVLLAWEEAEQDAGRKALLALPGMSETAADSILDWIDGDVPNHGFMLIARDTNVHREVSFVAKNHGYPSKLVIDYSY